MKYLLLLPVMVFNIANATISPETMIRCRAGITPERCERQRANALAKKCINQQEYDQLRSMGGMPTCYEEDGSFMGWCPCGCFAAETTVKTGPSSEESVQRVIELFAANHRPDILHLGPSATLKDVQLTTSPVRNVSVGPEEAPMVIIDTANKGHIELTINHPVLLSDGSILRAEHLKVGQKLLNYAGQPIEIQNISRKMYAGLVYNLNVDAANDNEHVVVANGFLMGDLYLQGSLSYFENQILVRK